MIVTEEKETVVIEDAVTEAVKVGVGVLLLTSVPLSAQREREVKAKAPLINFRCSYPAFVKISAIGRFPNKKNTLFSFNCCLRYLSSLNDDFFRHDFSNPSNNISKRK